MEKKPDWMKGRGRGVPRPPNLTPIGLLANQETQNPSNGNNNFKNTTNNEWNKQNNNCNSIKYKENTSNSLHCSKRNQQEINAIVQNLSVNNKKNNKQNNNIINSNNNLSNVENNYTKKINNNNTNKNNNSSNIALGGYEDIGKFLEGGKERFERAADGQKRATQRHLDKQAENNLSSDSDDDDDEDDEKKKKIIAKIIGSHDDNDDQVDMCGQGGRVEELMMETMAGKSNVCLVCIETLKKHEAIWSCKGCHTMIHLSCMQKWITDGSYQAIHPSLSIQNFPKQQQPWFCPKCRCSYERSEFPKVYLCFCGKVENPPFDSWLLPHSCGQVCGKQLKPSCGHSCLLLCHPGACPPCPKTIRASCHCGKAQPQMRRCGNSGWSCRQACMKRLKCHKHNCKDLCHKGECGECGQASERSCLCGGSVKVLPCADEGWKCDKVCGKHLDCGFHRCAGTCHKPPCSPCNRLCPCGKTRYGEDSCNGDVVLCSEVCGKLLSCGTHSCPDLCHTGPCNKCKEVVKSRCRCGRKEKEVACGRECVCEVKCARMKDCGVHVCKKKCCDGACPPCGLMCGRMLPCRQHKCNNTCHQGPCYPCSLTSTLSCQCGHTFIKVPCGAEKRMKPPKCHLPCKTPPDCKHPTRTAHHCHHGPCPKCTQVCNQARLSCTHPCKAPCHSAVEVRVRVGNKTLAGPWEVNKNAERVEIVDMECAPCAVPVAVVCLGGHETTMTPCHESKPRSCHRECGRWMACGNHTCKLECHAVVDEAGAGGSKGSSKGDTSGSGKNNTEGNNTKSNGISNNKNINNKILPTNIKNIKNIKNPKNNTTNNKKSTTILNKSTAKACEVCERVCSKARPTACPHGCLLPCHSTPCPPCPQLLKMRCHCCMVVLHVGCEEWGAAGDGNGGNVFGDGREQLMCCSSRCPKMLSCGHSCKNVCHSGNCSGRQDCVEKVKVTCPCGRRRSEVHCSGVGRGEGVLQCDGVCQEFKEKLEKEKENENLLKSEVEAKKRKEELEEFERSMKGGKRRRQRKPSSNHDEDNSFLHMHKNKIILSLLIALISAWLYWLGVM